MDFIEYKANVLRSESVPTALPEGVCVEQIAALLGVMKGAGVIVDAIKRVIFYRKPLDQEKLVAGLTATGISMDLLAAFSGVTDLAPEQVEQVKREVPCPMKREHVDANLRLLHSFVGMFGEVGELAGAYGEGAISGTMDLTNIGEELGDVDWYKAIGHDASGVSEPDSRRANIAKLRARYPEKFDAAQAVELRDPGAERLILEANLGIKADREQQEASA